MCKMAFSLLCPPGVSLVDCPNFLILLPWAPGATVHALCPGPPPKPASFSPGGCVASHDSASVLLAPHTHTHTHTHTLSHTHSLTLMQVSDPGSVYTGQQLLKSPDSVNIWKASQARQIPLLGNLNLQIRLHRQCVTGGREER